MGKVKGRRGGGWWEGVRKCDERNKKGEERNEDEEVVVYCIDVWINKRIEQC